MSRAAEHGAVRKPDLILVSLIAIAVCLVTAALGATVGGLVGHWQCRDKPEFTYDVLPCADDIFLGVLFGGCIGLAAGVFISVMLVRGARGWNRQ